MFSGPKGPVANLYAPDEKRRTITVTFEIEAGAEDCYGCEYSECDEEWGNFFCTIFDKEDGDQFLRKCIVKTSRSGPGKMYLTTRDFKRCPACISAEVSSKPCEYSDEYYKLLEQES